ncbi:chlorite dismutase [bacterium]|nr:chlorite dismutase [bacterium]
MAAKIQVKEGLLPTRSAPCKWKLEGVTSHERYTSRQEKDQLAAIQPPLGRPESTCAALIPIRKNAQWWAMTQDERQAIFTTQSNHTSIGMKYLPAVARRLYHCRDLAEPQPFDFLTWFEFAPSEKGPFDRLLAELRSRPEWSYVERETEIHLVRSPV